MSVASSCWARLVHPQQYLLQSNLTRKGNTDDEEDWQGFKTREWQGVAKYFRMYFTFLVVLRWTDCSNVETRFRLSGRFLLHLKSFFYHFSSVFRTARWIWCTTTRWPFAYMLGNLLHFQVCSGSCSYGSHFQIYQFRPCWWSMFWSVYVVACWIVQEMLRKMQSLEWRVLSACSSSSATGAIPSPLRVGVGRSLQQMLLFDQKQIWRVLFHVNYSIWSNLFLWLLAGFRNGGHCNHSSSFFFEFWGVRLT